MKIVMNDAENGDCIVVKTSAATILIDGGTSKSYLQWSQYVKDMGKIDLVVATHIDNDHVNGLIKLFEDPARPDISKVIYNGPVQILDGGYDISSSKSDDYFMGMSARFTELSDEVEEVGFSEGVSLSYMIENSGISVNSSVCFGSNELLKLNDCEILFLTPNETALKKLRSEWLAILKENGVRPRGISKFHASAFETYVSSIVENHPECVSAQSISELDKLADYPYVRDTSLANETSISFIVTSKGKKAIFLADSHAETVLEWLDKNKIESIDVDFMKLSHHGSKKNTKKELIKRFPCSCYAISTNGKIHKHPDLETLALVAKYSPNDNAKIFINNEISHISDEFCIEIFDKYGVEIVMGNKEFYL